jgi:tetratricopeptide (TPR) repeat protein
VEFAESNPDMINDNQIRFLVALNNLLNIQDELGKDEEVKATLEKIRSIRSKSTDIQMRVFTFTYTIEFTRLIIRGDFEKCISLRPEVEEGLIKFGNKINHEYLLALRFNLFYAYFGVGDFNESLKWLNKIVNDWHVELRKDVYSFIRIINLIIHLELGNADLLSYEIQSAKRFFKKEERLFRFETIILAFIEEISIINNRTSRTNAFKKLKTTLRQLQTDHHESQIMEFFDFDSWIESKLQGKSFRQIIQNNFKH